MRVGLVALLILLMAQTATAGHLHKEKEYQAVWCAKMGGETEVVLDDGTRVDCLTDQYAVEVDYAAKWAESVGQALYYSMQTNRRPGIVLILEKESDRRYLKRLEDLQTKYGLKVWTMTEGNVRSQSISSTAGASRLF